MLLIAGRLPHFDTLLLHYPGQPKYGGLVSVDGLMKSIGAANMTTPNDTCSLRISTMLNLVQYHALTSLPLGKVTVSQSFSPFPWDTFVIKEEKEWGEV